MERAALPATFATLLRRYRQAAGLTQEELAERAGLSVRGVADLERGARRVPHRETVRLLAEALVLPEEERAAFSAAARQLTRRPADPLSVDPRTAEEGVAQSWLYVAHAHGDDAFVARLRTELQQYGATIWVDEQDLLPGTPSWEQALREAIRASMALVLIASPETRSSRYVADELRIAEMYGRQVFPLWVAGEQWMDCVPLGWGGLQYYDARGERYHAAVVALAADVRRLQDRQVRATRPFSAPLTTAHEPRNPYKGLRAFTEDDAGDFFGRDSLVDAFIAATSVAASAAPRFLALVGASGSGKSSVVLAGVLPRLRTGVLTGSAEWIYLEPLLPGVRPLEALAETFSRALPGSTPVRVREELEDAPDGLDRLARRLATRPEQRVVLVVDQGEELFSPAVDEEERRCCIDLLVTAVTAPAGPVLVLLTLRADFYDRPLRYPGFGALLHAHSTVVLPPTTSDLRRAIEGPAALPDVQVTFDEDLVGDLMFDLQGQAGALPLLQFTLDQLFARREGRCLTSEAYRALGGVRGALALHAEATYATLPGAEYRILARSLFLRLIDPGVTEQDTTRRRATITEFVLPDPQQSARLQEVVQAFIAARLLVAARRPTGASGTAETTVEVSHEALIREWDRLGHWLRDAREDIRQQQTISASAAEWDRRGRPQDYLYRGAVLEEAHSWAARGLVSTTEQAFLEAGLAERARQETAERGRQAREVDLARQAAAASRQAATRLRTLVVVLAMFLLVAAVLAVVALVSATTARTEQAQAVAARATAVAERNQALSRQLAAQAVNHLDGQYDLALLLSLEANRVANNVEARSSLFEGIEQRPAGLITFLQGHTLEVYGLAISPDGKTLASGSLDGTIRFWDVARRQPLGPPLKSQSVTAPGLAFTPDGKTLVANGFDNAIRLWGVAWRRPLAHALSFPSYWSSAWSMALSPNGKILAVAYANGPIQLWDVAHWRPLGSPLLGHSDGVNSMAFSPDGKTLVSGGWDGTTLLWDVARQTPIKTLLSGSAVVFSVAFSPDGKTIAAGMSDGVVHLWSRASQWSAGVVLAGHTNIVNCVAFSPDGTTLASGSDDGTVRLWDVARQRSLGAPLAGHSGAVMSVVFSPDRTTLFAGTADGTIDLWNVGHLPTIDLPLTGPTDAVHGVAFSPDGRLLAAGSFDQTIWLWNVRSHRRINVPLVTSGRVEAVAFDAGGKILAGVNVGGVVDLWDVRHGGLLGTLSGSLAKGSTVAFSPDGKTLAVGGCAVTDTDGLCTRGGIELWDVARQQLRGPPLSGVQDFVSSVAFSPNGKLLASGSFDGTIQFWDVVHYRPIGAPLRSHTSAVNSVAFSPRGTLLASGSEDTTVRLWDVATRTPDGPPLRGHVDQVESVAFSPDGAVLVSGADDHTIRFWDVASGQALGVPLTGHADRVYGLAFSPTGAVLASGSGDHTVRLWNVDLTSWQRQACSIANRNLTPQEWQQYLGGQPYHATCPLVGH
ncbi:MAG TPA: TIR domain-containing protein [Chloroflexota bacterium]|nr:TIR domain-containing protein [Chloroflexota bacterium]